MSEETSQKNQQDSKEIDLLEVGGNTYTAIKREFKGLFGWIGHWLGQILLWIAFLLVWLYKYFVMFLRFIKKHIWVLLILSVIGAAVGYFKNSAERPFYQTEMLVQTQLVPRAQLVERINSLNRLTVDENAEVLSRILNLPLRDVEHLFHVRADVVNQAADRSRRTYEGGETVESDRGDIVGPEVIRVRIRLWENHSIERLTNAFVKFIEEDSYTKDRLRIFRQSNLARQENLKEEVEYLRKFQQKNIEKESQPAITTLFGDAPVMVQQSEDKTYTEEILAIKNQIIALESSYELTKPLEVVQPFIPVLKPVNRLYRNVFLFGGLFFVAGCVCLNIRRWWKML